MTSPTYYRPSLLLRVVPLVALTGLVLALVLYAGARERRAYAHGKADARAGATFDSALVAQVAQAVALQTARTDTVVQRVVVYRDSVRVLVQSVPDSLRPTLTPLIRVTEGLADRVDSLLVAHGAERAAWTERARVDSAALWSLQILASARADTTRRWPVARRGGAL